MDPSAEPALIARLRAGDERAFAELVAEYQPRLTRLARAFLSPPDLAEDAVQETWIAVLRGIGRFEGRSSLHAWLFQICANRARSMAARERRAVPLDSLPDTEGIRVPESAVDVYRAIADLPETQRQVLVLRDVEGWSAREVCAVLTLSEANQRVLLHRGRAGVRLALFGRSAA